VVEKKLLNTGTTTEERSLHEASEMRPPKPQSASPAQSGLSEQQVHTKILHKTPVLSQGIHIS
jgi:hypothetical protein